MKRLRKSARKVYRHDLVCGIRGFLNRGVFLGDPALEDRHFRWRQWVLAVVAILMAWDCSPTLMERFMAIRELMPRLYPGVPLGNTYQGFMRALLKSQEAMWSRIHDYWRQRLPGVAGPYWTLLGLLAFAVDGSRVECPRTAANEKALGRAGRDKTGPQLFLTTLYHMGSGCPWAFQIGPGTDSERNHLRQMLPLVPPGAWLVADAGFVGYELLERIVSSGRHFLFRVGSNVRLLQELGYAQEERPDIVCLWPNKAQKGQRPPLVLRLIVVNDGRQPMYLLTDAPEEQMLSAKQAGVLYQMRWGVEVFYRSLKETLEHRKMRSAAPRQAQSELAWAMTGLWMLSLMGVEAIVAKNGHPLSLSVAQALRRIRQVMRKRRRPARRRENLRTLLGGAVKDTYTRRTSKASRDRPRKKKEKPPGPPHITTATQEQVAKAKALRDKTKPAQFTA